jgi:hypothetical protein
MPQEQVNKFVIYGTPEDVIRQIELLEEAGIQYLIVDLDPSKELEALDIFAKEIIKKVLISSINWYAFRLLRCRVRNASLNNSAQCILRKARKYYLPSNYILIIKKGMGATTARVQDHFRFVLDPHLRTVQFL